MYIKIKIQDVLDGKISTLVGEELEAIFKKYGLQIEKQDDIGTKLIYQDIGEYRYLLVRAFDLPNKCRQHEPTQEEIDDINAYIFVKGFDIVFSLPEILEEKI